jgi:hypothetical protein
VRQVLCPVLVGRDDEVQVLLDGLDRAAEGEGGAFVVTGEAGVGKSRLVREVAQLAGARGLPVLTGRAVAGGAAVPFRPLAEAVMGGLRRSGRLDLPEVRSLRPALGPVMPDWLPAEPVPGAKSPVVLGEALLRLLHVLGEERGCLLILENLHRADPESLSIVEYLADNVATERLVCLATLRADEGGAGAAWSTRWSRGARCGRLRHFIRHSARDRRRRRWSRAC